MQKIPRPKRASKFKKLRPLISEKKLAFGCALLFSKTKQKAQRDTTIRTILQVESKTRIRRRQRVRGT